jgi:NCS2 family nucleobase:cation symporter-2
MVVVMIESTGMFLVLGEMTGKRIGADDIARGLRPDGVGTIIGGVLNAFPHTSVSQNVGLVRVTGVRSRHVPAAGVILVVLSVIPKLAALVASVPLEVLGGTEIVMFGIVAATGVRIFGIVDFHNNRNKSLHCRDCAGIRDDPDGGSGLLQELLESAQACPRFRHYPDDCRRGPARRIDGEG